MKSTYYKSVRLSEEELIKINLLRQSLQDKGHVMSLSSTLRTLLIIGLNESLEEHML